MVKHWQQFFLHSFCVYIYKVLYSKKVCTSLDNPLLLQDVARNALLGGNVIKLCLLCC